MIRITGDATHAIDLTRRYSLALHPWMLAHFLRDDAQPYLEMRTRQRFAKEGDEASGKWAELASATGKIRASKGFPAWHPINRRTGELLDFASSTYTVRTTNASATLSMPGKGSKRQTDKLRIAQQGGYPKSTPGARRAGPSKPAPPRPVVALSMVDERYLSLQLLNWIRTYAGTMPGRALP